MDLPKRTKKKFENIITLYGRKPVLESLKDESVQIFRLHVSDSNKEGETINETLRIAELRGVEVVTHSRRELSRISKNSRQDQGVAVDIEPKRYEHVKYWMSGDPDDSCTFFCILWTFFLCIKFGF